MNNVIIGETCLLSKQLRRLGILTEAKGCFEDVMINLDCVDKIVDNDFEGILDEDKLEFKSYLYYPKHGIAHTKWINTEYSVDHHNIFSWDVFSLFHFDVKNEETIQSFERKIARVKDAFENDKPTCLHYYYRLHDGNYDINAIVSKLQKFVTKIENKYKKKFAVALYTEDPFGTPLHDLCMKRWDSVYHFSIPSTSTWVGIDENWDAHTDDHQFDLVGKWIKRNLNI